MLPSPAQMSLATACVSECVLYRSPPPGRSTCLELPWHTAILKGGPPSAHELHGLHALPCDPCSKSSTFLLLLLIMGPRGIIGVILSSSSLTPANARCLPPPDQSGVTMLLLFTLCLELDSFHFISVYPVLGLTLLTEQAWSGLELFRTRFTLFKRFNTIKNHINPYFDTTNV